MAQTRKFKSSMEIDMSHSIQAGQAARAQKRTPILKKQAIVLPIMSVVAGTLTGIMTWANVGFTDEFLSIWGKSFITAMRFTT